MTWSERMQLAWTTFKREALPLYGWTLIFIGVGVVLVIAMVMGVLDQLRWVLPQAYGGSFSSGMPVPGIPPADFSGPLSNFFNVLSAVGSVAGTLFLILIVSWLIGSAFYTGLFNLTAKAYRQKVTFKDFSFTGFFRILGWQGFLLMIKLLLLIIGLSGAFTLSHSQGALTAFLIIYGLFIIAVAIFALPWLTTSAIYLLAHRKEKFWDALRGSWRFFRNHMGLLWGYIGTVILIEIAIEVLSRISQGAAGLAALVVSPFIAVLAIVWVLSLEPQLNPTTPDSVAIDSPSPIHYIPKVATPESEALNIDLQEATPCPPFPEDKPNYCPSCGKANNGTPYCPQCGSKL